MPIVSSGAASYFVTVPVGTTPVTVAEFKAWAKITNTAEDALITLILQRVTEQAELYTKRDFINKTYVTYRDIFGDGGENPSFAGYPAMNYAMSLNTPISLRRSQLQSVTSVKYYSDNVLTTLSSAAYYIIRKQDFGMIQSVDGAAWPLVDDRNQAVEITFVAGYGATAASVPPSLRSALLAHANQVYANRGDCDVDSPDSCSCSLAPSAAKSAYNQFRIIDFVG